MEIEKNKIALSNGIVRDMTPYENSRVLTLLEKTSKRRLSEKKTILRNEYEQARQASIDGIQVRDGGDRENIREAIENADKPWAPATIDWKLEDNTFRTVTKTDLEHVLEQYAQRKFTLWESLQQDLANLV